ncbi:Polyphosphate:AMP phosphotransferase [Filimonas lacunae]|uniref:Polyphosphate:AMP phosphotransferase n=1 Tax=Filimonas lacunae TaxID=477680 RepID=A0A1N7KW97_9BACT|nr:PPK2 family polyphosphate kinase [Filimonas lacunae]SIS65865.1 Polyphosphate:AMP phosphotransferase [Filimonas lacunae]
MGRIKLEEIDTRAPGALQKEQVKLETAGIISELNELQNLLYAESKHSVLVVLQGMDASGKDGLIRKVFGNLNPQGVMVHSFKVPTAEELGHDFLWRIHKNAPAKGMIQLFNRSHYEDILVTRVHNLCDKETAYKRMRAINDFEWLLAEHNNTTILKFYLHISEKEQSLRLNERLDDKTKQWKYNESDFAEAKLWPEYRKVYEDCFEECNKIPWTIVPADQNWYKEYIVAKKLKDALSALKMRYPGLKKA